MGPDASRIEVGADGAESRLVLYPMSMMKDCQERKRSIVFEGVDLKRMHRELSSRGVVFE